MNLFRLSATLGLDTSEYDRNADKAVSKGRSMAKSIGGAMAKGVKLLGAGVAAAGSAVAAVTTMAIKNYAEYEQLVGGVETLFGESADAIMNYARNAYMTAGLSANEYMEQATSFSASLVQSLGGDTAMAAEYANQAITDMSDNANKMGTDISLIQNAYQGFAKQNYTMLDNLKLGYGGTKEEMERLIADASELSGIELNMGNFADIIYAIHVVQENMGVAGTTAKEAATTIQGSLGMVKASWTNLVTGLADKDANLRPLIANFVDSVSTAAGNLIPVLEQALMGVGQLIEDLLPKILDRIPYLLTTVLPRLLESGANMLHALIDGINSNLDLIMDSVFLIIQTLADLLISEGPALLQMGFNILITLMNGIAEHPDEVVNTTIMLISTLLMTIVQNLPALIEAGANMVAALMKELWDPATLKTIGRLAMDLVAAMLSALGDSLLSIFDAGVQIVQAIVDGIASVWNDLCNWFSDLWNSLFGGLQVDVGVNADSSGAAPSGANSSFHGYSPASIDGSHANGLGYVPFDGYVAELHKGERVLTSSEAADYNRPINIVVQSVLDGKIIGQTAYKYSRQKARAFG